jgi:anti-sigma regulatory factor (Ser/Thr protein kinase)
VTAVVRACHAAFEHTVVFYDEPADLARTLAPLVREGLDHGDAVLVCLDAPRWAALAGLLGPATAARVTYQAADVRYARPTTALSTLLRFVEGAVRDGAPAVWSIGEVAFGGDLPDADWVRYEAAVNDVLAHLPLRAVCAYDRTALSADLLEAARLTHPVPGASPADDAHPPIAPAARAIDPAGPLLVELHPVLLAADARHAVSAAVAGRLSSEREGDLEVVISELVSNGLRHGAQPVTLRVWADDRALTIEVTDAGGGLVDPFPELRPPTPDPGGLGIWLVGQLTDRLVIEHRDARTTFTARFATAG